MDAHTDTRTHNPTNHYHSRLKAITLSFHFKPGNVSLAAAAAIAPLQFFGTILIYL